MEQPKRRRLLVGLLALLPTLAWAGKSKGGRYAGGKGSSHKGGSYVSPKGKRYQRK